MTPVFRSRPNSSRRLWIWPHIDTKQVAEIAFAMAYRQSPGMTAASKPLISILAGAALESSASLDDADDGKESDRVCKGEG